MPDDPLQPQPDGFASGMPPTRQPSTEPNIPLKPTPGSPPKDRPPPRTQPAKPQAEVKDGAREVVETVVFVVVLVLLLKTFLAEAFVIPTGSMATTLLGYHKERLCDKCGYRIRVNASEEAENRGAAATFCICPNCRYRNLFSDAVPRFPGGAP